MLLIGVLPSHYYFIQISMVDFEKQIFFIGSWHLENDFFWHYGQNTVLWNVFFPAIDIVSYGPYVYLS